MQWQDGVLLAKKIFIGLILTLLPFIILFEGLRIMQKVLGGTQRQQSSAPTK